MSAPCVCSYTYVCVHIRILIRNVCIILHLRLHTCTCMHAYTLTCTCHELYVCVYVCMCVCVHHMCTHICEHIPLHVHVYTYTYACIHIYIRIHIHTHVHIYTSVRHTHTHPPSPPPPHRGKRLPAGHFALAAVSLLGVRPWELREVLVQVKFLKSVLSIDHCLLVLLSIPGR